MDPIVEGLNQTREYTQLLAQIRPLICNLKSPEDATHCLIWLSRLDQADIQEKNLRNSLLRILFNQVKIGKISFPFNEKPEGLLHEIYNRVKNAPMSPSTERSNDISSESSVSSLIENHGTVDDQMRAEQKHILTKDYLSRKLEEHQKAIEKISSEKIDKIRNFYEDKTRELDKALKEASMSNNRLLQESHGRYSELKKENADLVSEYVSQPSQDRMVVLDDNLKKLSNELKKMRDKYEKLVAILMQTEESLKEKESLLRQYEEEGGSSGGRGIRDWSKQLREQREKYDSSVREKDLQIAQLKKDLQHSKQEIMQCVEDFDDAYNQQCLKVDRLNKELFAAEKKIRELEELLQTEREQHLTQFNTMKNEYEDKLFHFRRDDDNENNPTTITNLQRKVENKTKEVQFLKQKLEEETNKFQVKLTESEKEHEKVFEELTQKMKKKEMKLLNLKQRQLEQDVHQVFYMTETSGIEKKHFSQAEWKLMMKLHEKQLKRQDKAMKNVCAIYELRLKDMSRSKENQLSALRLELEFRTKEENDFDVMLGKVDFLEDRYKEIIREAHNRARNQIEQLLTKIRYLESKVLNKERTKIQLNLEESDDQLSTER